MFEESCSGFGYNQEGCVKQVNMDKNWLLGPKSRNKILKSCPSSQKPGGRVFL